ncbi:hypothetical protein [Legionella maioricensis]|uniref:Transmembrane protein n=1 Tax=Legionella maioricensis TaxID=2896528 RepID=A0A9X2D3E1_9GAMM|nr:hypothetical protein [Legionella maioricensis]MCL9685696.1 hypothetical protein [Legionella maioricensis]MCL9689147.1 hypothetical protein [Legionella maioricensis]
MNLLKSFPWFNEAWKSYAQCRTVLWWPLSFLFLTPLAVLIVFGVIIPFGLNELGWINFNHSFLNYTYLLLVAGLIFFAIFPFLDGLYQLIKANLDGNSINENTAFSNLFNSQAMGKALGPVLVILILLEVIGSFFKPFKMLVLFGYMLTIFTPILLVNEGKSPWKKGVESVRFTLGNKKLVTKVWGLRLLILLSLIFPWVLVACTGAHLALKVIALLFALPFFGYMVVNALPFYFFYPAYVYERMKSSTARVG